MFHKTDAQVKNIFHSIARSKSGLEKCAILNVYAKGIRGAEEDPEARRIALENAKASARHLLDPNATVKAEVTTAAIANRPVPVTASPNDYVTPPAIELIDRHSETVTEAGIGTNNDQSSGRQVGSVPGAARAAVGEAGATESTNAAPANGCGCSTGQLKLRSETLNPLYTLCDSAHQPAPEAYPQTVYAAGSVDVDGTTLSDLDAAEEWWHARDYDPRSDPLLLLRAHHTRTRAVLQTRTPAPVPIGCLPPTTSAFLTSLADPDWRSEAPLPGLQDPAMEPSLGFSGRGSPVTLGGWDMEYMSPFVSLGFDPQTGELPRITHSVPAREQQQQQQLPSNGSSTTGAVGGCRGAEDVPCAPVLSSGTASVLPPQRHLQLQHPQAIMPQQQWQPPSAPAQQQPLQTAAFDDEPLASFLADLLQEEHGNGVCGAGDGIPGVDRGGAEPVKAFSAPNAPVNGCNPYGMSGNSIGLWQLAPAAGQSVTAPLLRGSSCPCYQSEGSWGSCAADAAAATQLLSGHSAPAAVPGHSWPPGPDDTGYFASLSTSQAGRWLAAVPPTASCQPYSSIGAATPPTGLAAGLVPQSTSCHPAAPGPAVPSGWDTGSGHCALWSRPGHGL